jgi:hypothetical protein
MRGLAGVKTFLKFVVFLVVAIIAVKLLPLTIALGFVLGGAIVALAAVGVSVIALLFGLAVFLLTVLSPVWIPLLALIGLIALIRGSGRRGETA